MHGQQNIKTPSTGIENVEVRYTQYLGRGIQEIYSQNTRHLIKLVTLLPPNESYLFIKWKYVVAHLQLSNCRITRQPNGSQIFIFISSSQVTE